MPIPLRNLVLTRPIAAIDLETTGVDTRNDRIVEVAAVRVTPDARVRRFQTLVHPGIPIPTAATAIHGIGDADVADCPAFDAIAPRLARLLDGCDLAGFNLKRFDLPFLAAEFARAEVHFPLAGRAVLDAMQIYHDREPRDLDAAVRFFLGREHDGAHGALADAEASLAVLDAQVARYDDLPENARRLHRRFADADIAGRFRLEDGRFVFAFGKYQGSPLRRVARLDPGYLRWFLEQDFLDDAKELVRRALERAAR